MNIADLFYSVKAEGIDKVGSQISALGDAVTDVGNMLIENLSKPILEVGENIVKTTMSFDKEMSRVSAVTSATGKNFTTLRDLAIDMGSSTSKTATEAAEAIEYMGLAGWDLTQIQEGLEPMIRASEAGMMDLGRTSDLVTDSMAALGIGTKDMAKYLDIAANAQINSNQTMEQFLEAMVTAGGSFKMFNVPLEEAGALLGILANRGYKGAEAGNAIISIMNNLTTGTGRAGKAMKELNIDLYDGHGKFRGMTVILKELNEKFADMTDKQRDAYVQMIGGKTRTKELNALLNGTSEELDKLTGKLYNSEGALSAMAKTMQDNLAGKITKLKSVLEGIAIQIGDRLVPIIEFFADKLQILAEGFFNLPGPVKDLSIVLALLTTLIGPIISGIGILITTFGGLVLAISAIVALISTVGLPVFGAIIAILLIIPIHIAAVTTAIGIFTGAIALIIAKLGIFSDGIATVKALLSGDFQKMFDLLTEKLGMSDKAAGKLAKAFVEMYDKAQIVIQVIRDNIGPAFELLKENITNLITGGFDKLNGSTSVSKNLFIDMVQSIVKWGGELVNYLYTVLDTFGLIPTKLKFANDEVAAKYVELKAIADNALNGLLNSQYMFSENMTAENKKAYALKIEDTKKALDDELNFVIQKLDERKIQETNKLKELFENSAILTREQEIERLALLQQNYTDEKDLMNINYAEINNIIQTAANEHRRLTEEETLQIQYLKEQAAQKEVQVITDSKAEQLRILEESKNLTVQLNKDETMAIIVESNKAYDKEVENAKKKKDDKIKEAIIARDSLKIISSEEASGIIKEADRQYTESVKKSKNTKDETIANAMLKYDGVLTAAELEQREVTTQADILKKALDKVWDDIKKSLPQKMKEAMIYVKNKISENSDAIVSAAVSVGVELATGLVNAAINYIKNHAGDILSAAASILSGGLVGSVNIGGQKAYPQKGHAKGLTNSPYGHYAIVGEEGPELMYVPKGADIYTANETKGMLNNTKSGIGSGNYNNYNNSKQEIFNFNGNVLIDPNSIKDVEDVIDIFRTLKIEQNMR